MPPVPLISPERPTRTTRTVHDIIQDSGITGHEEGQLLSIVVDDVTIAEEADIIPLWLQRSEWLYSQSDLQHFFIDDQGTPREIEGGYIFAEWRLFISRNGENLKRLLEAMAAEYNPLTNYDLTEQSSEGEARDRHRVTPHGKVVNETKPYTTGINSTGDGAQTGKTRSETFYESNADSETSYDNTKSIPNNQGEAVTGFHTAAQHFLRRFGNIGVKGNAQLIEEEYSIRYRDTLSEFVRRFFDQYCYYVG